MKASIVLADTGRPQGASVNLLNAGWSFTQAFAMPDGGWALPEQAVAVFLEADMQEQNRPLTLDLRLVDDDGQLAQFAGNLEEPELQNAIVQQAVMVPPVPGAPSGTPGHSSFLIGIDAGMIRISAPRRRYVWKLEIEGSPAAEVGFWVNQAPEMPSIGGTTN